MDITLHQASELIKNGHVIGVPTETVYGLAASLFEEAAVDQIFTLKGRPLNNPLIIHVARIEDVLPFVGEVDEDFCELAKAFWPGPLTIVMGVREEMVPIKVRAGLKTAAFRVPAHELARELLKLTGPLVMPSANVSGKPSSTSRAHVEADFGADFPVLDGGECVKGLESTILYKNEATGKYEIIRQGALSAEDFEAKIGYKPEVVGAKVKNGEQPICPGQLYRHYAPRAKLTLVKDWSGKVDWDGVVVGFEGRKYPEGCKVYVLGKVDDAESVSRSLYGVLRKLDEDGVQEAVVDVGFDGSGVLATVLERLYKASSGI